MRRVFFILILLLGGTVGTLGAEALRLGQTAADIAGDSWINSPPLTMHGLKGRVVLVEFWTYG